MPDYMTFVVSSLRLSSVLGQSVNTSLSIITFKKKKIHVPIIMTQTMGTLALGTLEMEVPHLFDSCPALLFTWKAYRFDSHSQTVA